MDLNRLFSKDGGHTTQPYLPLEPEIAITTGQYASEVDVLLGLSFIFSFSQFGNLRRIGGKRDSDWDRVLSSCSR